MISVFWNASPCLHDRTRGDLTMADVSGEGDEEFAGERDNRNAADPAALGANAQQLRALAGWYLTHIQASSTIGCADADCRPSRSPVRGRRCHSSMDWEPGRHRPPTAVGSQTGGIDPQGRAQ